MFRRLREEAPLYYNEQFDFYALSRYEDVERVWSTAQTYSSAAGRILEQIKADIDVPPGRLIFEDPPIHTPTAAHAVAGVHAEADERPRTADPGVLRPVPRPARRRRAVRLRRRPGQRDAHADDRHAAGNPRGRIRRRSGTSGATATLDEPGQPMELAEDNLVDGDSLRRVHRVAGRAPRRRPDDRAAAGRVRGRDAVPCGA